MLRFRRYRVFLICAILLTFLIIRLSRRNERDGPSFPDVKGESGTLEGDTETRRGGHEEHSEGLSTTEQEPTKDETLNNPVLDITKLAQSTVAKSKSSSHDEALAYSPTSSSIQPLQTPETVKTIPSVIPPDRTVTGQISAEDLTEINENLNGTPWTVDPVANTKPTPIHWEKQAEHFPVAPESIIHLPTGKPKPIPRVQFAFKDETVMDRAKRLKRQDKVKIEFKRAWDGYKSQAWMHDEVRPVSGGFRDPFGGWAATLVDSLDTLWIMGFEEDFEEAVRAVGTIDFTTSTRSEIQVFETVIRYLGGLLGAYDVSGGTKRILLEKAVELAEILMGAFDTHNRMPILFYRWKPAFASQPHRARPRSVLAEFGTLSLEFTRLAQLTRETKYYDAIARITDALEEWQNRGTDLPGVFPHDVDTSGCNQTVPVISNSKQSIVPLPPNSSSVDTEDHDISSLSPENGNGGKETTLGNIELTIVEGLPGEPGKAQIQTKTDSSPNTLSSKTVANGNDVQNLAGRSEAANTQDTVKSSSASRFGRFSLKQPGMELGDWDCIPQGLTSGTAGYGSFSMGGGLDSFYEYLPKQYLLLGGLEDKYLTMYSKAMDAVRKNMLFRPMLPDNRDVRFTGKVDVRSQSGNKFDAEVTHLTCFVGGMFGIGSKIFNIERDLEIAEKLTDGCVWAYESTASGIMPEFAQVLPCESLTDCLWNQTLWEESLDPIGHERDENVKLYDTNRAALHAKAQQQRVAAETKHEVEENEKSSTPETKQPQDAITGSESIGEVNDVDVDSVAPPSTRFDTDIVNNTISDQPGRKDSSIRKRQAGKEGPSTTGNSSWQLNSTEKSEAQYQTKLEDTKVELDSTTAGRDVKTPPLHVPESQAPIPDEIPVDSKRPMSHKEYVEHRIKEEGIPLGFLQIRDSKYILRPEAIESVWYMYRITGDPLWQEKGWAMFERIIDATRTTYGHSAIKGTTRAIPDKTDEMESFWLSETLKYFYLLYSMPDKISLDDYVLNTEAHPFKRPK